MFKKPHDVSQEHIWVAEYYKGSLKEFENEETQNGFYDIDKDELVRFGLSDIGWFECYKGTFNIKGQSYELLYKYGDRVVPLTGQDMFYRDIITYKKAYAEASMTKAKGEFTNKIVGYYFGYKVEFEVDGIRFNFKPIVSNSIGQAMYLDIHLVADSDVNGKLVILKNGKEVDGFNAPLEKDVAGGIQWKIR